MSSVKLRDDLACDTDESEAATWVAVRSPRTKSGLVGAGDVAAAIAGARLGYIRGTRRVETYTTIPEYGSGDASLADDIDRAVAEAWDA